MLSGFGRLEKGMQLSVLAYSTWRAGRSKGSQSAAGLLACQLQPLTTQYSSGGGLAVRSYEQCLGRRLSCSQTANHKRLYTFPPHLFATSPILKNFRTPPCMASNTRPRACFGYKAILAPGTHASRNFEMYVICTRNDAFRRWVEKLLRIFSANSS